MKSKTKFSSIALLAAALTLTAGTAGAAPFASQITVSSTSVEVGDGLTIAYFINEAGSTVTIEVLSSTNTILATFAGTATVGANSVVWNGTADNASGAAVGAGSGRKVQITAAKTAAAGWAEIASNRSVGNFGAPATLNTLFAGFSGRDVHSFDDPNSPRFGIVVSSSSFSVPAHYGFIPFNPDLSVYGGGDGLTARVMKHPADPLVATIGAVTSNQATWGVEADPDNSENLYVFGQGLPDVTYANNAAAGSGFADLTSISPNAATANYRGGAVRTIASVKFAYLASGNSTITRRQIDGTNQILLAPSDNILGLTAANLYSREVLFDAAGNLYWVSRFAGTAGAGNGRLFRWSAALASAAVAASLTEANADWVVTLPSTGADEVTDAIIAPNGSVFLVAESGIYAVGNTSDATKTITLTASEKVLDFAALSGGFVLGPLGGADMDFAGNIIVCENVNEQIRTYTPGGNTSVVVPAPSAQAFDIVMLSSSQNWEMYK